jgi:uncharacterized protein YkuJ
MYQYVEGDTTVDIVKMFTGKSRKALDTRDKSRKYVADQPHEASEDMTLKEFCTTLLVEMRSERDTLCADMKLMSQYMDRMEHLEKKVTRVSQDLEETRDIVTRLDALVHEHGKMTKRLDKQAERVSEVKHLLDTNLVAVNACTQNIGNIAATTTQRINNMELIIRQNGRQLYVPRAQNPVSCGSPMSSTQNTTPEIQLLPELCAKSPTPKCRDVTTVHNGGVNVDNIVSSVQHIETRQISLTPATNCTPHKGATITVSVPNLRKLPDKPENRANSEQSDKPCLSEPRNTMSPDTSADRSLDTSTEPSTTEPSTETAPEPPPPRTQPGDPATCDLELKGFIPVERRVRNAALYVAGILINENVDKTILCVYNYLKERQCQSKSIRKLKESGNTLSLKILIPVDCCDNILAENFWPKGIFSRKWIN